MDRDDFNRCETAKIRHAFAIPSVKGLAPELSLSSRLAPVLEVRCHHASVGLERPIGVVEILSQDAVVLPHARVTDETFGNGNAPSAASTSRCETATRRDRCATSSVNGAVDDVPRPVPGLGGKAHGKP